MYVLAYVGIMANNMAIPAMGCLGYPCNGFPRNIPVMGCRGCPCNGLPFFVWRIIGSLPLKGIPKEVSYAHLDTTKEASYSYCRSGVSGDSSGYCTRTRWHWFLIKGGADFRLDARASNTSKSTTNTSRAHLDPLQRLLRQPLRQRSEAYK